MATDERRIERWARSWRASFGATPSGVERRVLLESPRAELPHTSRRFWKSPPIRLLSAAFAIPGIVGIGSLASSPELTGWPRGFDAETSVVIAGVGFSLSMVFVIGLSLFWFVERRERSSVGVGAVVVLFLLPAVVSWLLMYGDNIPDRLSIWVLPMWGTIAISGGWLVMLVLLSRPADEPMYPPDVATLSPTEVAELLELRNQTLRTLEERKLLPAEIVERAQHLPLGELHSLDEETRRLKGPGYDAGTNRS